MSRDDVDALIDLFDSRRGVGLIQVRTARSSLTLRRSTATSLAAPVVEAVEGVKLEITANTVGTVHLRPRNGSDVEVGMTVQHGQEIGWIETSGRKTTVIAAASGVVAAVDVAYGEFVEYGQVLVELLPAGATESRD